MKTCNRVCAFGASSAGVLAGFLQRVGVRALALAFGVLALSAVPQVAFARAADVAVLRADDERADSAGDRLKESFERMEKNLDSIYNFNRFVFIPALFLILAGVIALFFKGSLWGVAP